MKSVPIPRLLDILKWKCGEEIHVSTHDDCLTSWPEEHLGPVPDDRTLLQWQAEWEALPADDPAKDPKAALIKDIRSATTIAALKALVEKLVR